jgi:hypothetical protein
MSSQVNQGKPSQKILKCVGLILLHFDNFNLTEMPKGIYKLIIMKMKNLAKSHPHNFNFLVKLYQLLYTYFGMYVMPNAWSVVV